VAEPTDVQRLAREIAAGATPEERRALLDALMSGQVASIFEKLQADEEPTLRPIPDDVRGFRVRLDLHGARPPVWRRLELPGDLTLTRLHDVIQASMGWHDGHLHRFRTARDHRSPSFVTQFDLDEGDEGVLEDDVRVDQLLAASGDELWYEYDFGDGWEHRLVVEDVSDDPPATARCVAGRMACPPEDCGGLGGYEALAAWVRSGYDDALLPAGFENAAQARDWLPLDWHPDHFDVDAADAAVAGAVAEPVALTGELAELSEELDRRGIRLLRQVLGRPLSHGPTDVTEEEAARLTRTYRTFLQVVGDGVKLTAAGYLPPAVVEQFAERSGIAGWWIGKANREDLTPPVAGVRDAARALGLVTVRQGHLAPTSAGRRCRGDGVALWRHVVTRLPLGRSDFDRHAGWLTLAVAGSGVPVQDWRDEVSDLLMAVGWRSDGGSYALTAIRNPTLEVLEELAGAASAHRGLVEGVDPGVATTARAVIRRG
jgi:hypothetical protein